MDINELLQREQVSLANAAGAACPASRRAHEGLARRYGERLMLAGFPHRRHDLRFTRGPVPAVASPIVAIGGTGR